MDGVENFADHFWAFIENAKRECPTCQGTGWCECDVGTDEDGHITADADVCWRCNGEGRVKG